MGAEMNDPIPEVLTYSLTTIIGFYFGTGISEGSRKAPSADPPDAYRN